MNGKELLQSMSEIENDLIIQSEFEFHQKKKIINWGLKQNEPHALVNELKPEIIVRDGQPFIVNGGDPAFTSLKQGDIVFNGEQSEALLKNGYVTGSHGKLAYEGAHSLGTAFSNGTGKLIHRSM